MQSDAGTVSIHTNIDAFVLSDITRDHWALPMLREYRRTRDPRIISKLKDEDILHTVHEHKNLITTVGRNVLARLVTGDTTYSGEINYGALGDNNTAVNNSDTTLTNETSRKLFDSHSTDGNNVAYVDFFYTTAEAIDTHEEWGTFIAGTASVDTGRMFSHMLTGGWIKTGAQALFVSCQYQFS